MARRLFTVTVFLSAFLLFLVQPMVGRLLLPVLGGSAQVWTACLVFFQSALLGGYMLAHGLTLLPRAPSSALHVAVLVLGALALPVAVGGLLEAPVDANLTLWLLGMLALSIGPPFVALACNAPTLQRWFQHTDDPARDDPYFLYSASNVGSLLGLLVYPLAFEPLLTLTQQRALWSGGYGVLVLLVAGCALISRHGPAQTVRPPRDDSAVAGAVAWRQVGGWLGLALIPSSLTVGVTAYVSTELAPIPLLWVLPLGLYLITFIQAFAGRTIAADDRRVRLAALAAFPLAVWHVSMTAPTWVLVFLHLGAFYLIALLCHSRLYSARPPARHLTAFYLWIAFGGALGGTFNALVAPAVFDTAAEYPLMLILSAAAVGASSSARGTLHRLLPRIVAGLAVLWVALTAVPNPSVALWIPAGRIAQGMFNNPRVRAAAAAVLAVLLLRVTLDGVGEQSYVVRSFFAVHRVVDEYKPGYRALIHGATLHGMQASAPDAPLEAVTYFAREGPIGQVFEGYRDRLQGGVIGIIGLGAGELASYAMKGQRWVFFEIDPVVEQIARERFSYLSRSQGEIHVELGDGRLSLSRWPHQFSLIVMDAFSSDAIPTHLVTTEAVTAYLDRLAPGGLIAVNVSNRFVDLEQTLARLARATGLVGRIQFDSPGAPAPGRQPRLASIWVVLARSQSDLGPLAHDRRWNELPRDDGRAWTDEKADVLGTVRWRQVVAVRAPGG